MYDEQSRGDDVGDEVTSDTFIKSGIVLVQVHNRQVADFLKRSRRRRELAVNLHNRTVVNWFGSTLFSAHLQCSWRALAVDSCSCLPVRPSVCMSNNHVRKGFATGLCCVCCRSRWRAASAIRYFDTIFTITGKNLEPVARTLNISTELSQLFDDSDAVYKCKAICA